MDRNEIRRNGLLDIARSFPPLLSPEKRVGDFPMATRPKKFAYPEKITVGETPMATHPKKFAYPEKITVGETPMATHPKKNHPTKKSNAKKISIKSESSSKSIY
jgi:hypothetical protein